MNSITHSLNAEIQTGLSKKLFIKEVSRKPTFFLLFSPSPQLQVPQEVATACCDSCTKNIMQLYAHPPGLD